MDNYAGNAQLPPQQSVNIGQPWGQASQGIQNLQNIYGGIGGSVLPGATATASNLYNNPYGPQAQSGAGAASALGANAAMTGFNTGAGMSTGFMSSVPYAQQILGTAFDPQQDLYNRTLQHVTDQSRVSQAARGVNTTPYGAGLENDATRNFNIDWQNQQLGRQAQGAGAAGNFMQTGANISGQGVNMMNQAPGQLARSAMLPYATYSGMGQDQNQALMSLLGISGAGANLAQMPIQNLLSMLGIGNQTNQVANQQAQLQLNQDKLGWDQMMGLGKGIGSLFGMGNFFGGGDMLAQTGGAGLPRG